MRRQRHLANPRRPVPTRRAVNRRQAGTNLAFRAPTLEALNPEVRRALALERSGWPLELARDHLLRVISELAPDVLTELSKLKAWDEQGISAWSRSFGLEAEWVHVVARSTCRLWAVWPNGRGRVWDFNHTDKGAQVPERGRMPAQPGELLIRQDHFEWFVRRRVLKEPFRSITDPPETSRIAVAKLARVLGFA